MRRLVCITVFAALAAVPLFGQMRGGGHVGAAWAELGLWGMGQLVRYEAQLSFRRFAAACGSAVALGASAAGDSTGDVFTTTITSSLEAVFTSRDTTGLTIRTMHIRITAIHTL